MGELPTNAAAILFAILLIFATLAVPLRAQSVTDGAAPEQPLTDWQAAAGGKQAFTVASIKPNASGLPPAGDRQWSNIPLGPGDMYRPTGGLMTSVNYNLVNYIAFAYKLTGNELRPMMSQFPKWVVSERFDIDARAEGNPTKDQYRLMMQALLADRFKLMLHHETKQLPVYALVLAKPEKLGPQLRAHPSDAKCTTVLAPVGTAASMLGPDGYPAICGGVYGETSSTEPPRMRFGARNVTMVLIAKSFPSIANLDRPVVNRTGLSGMFDFTVEFAPQVGGPSSPGAAVPTDSSGLTFSQALNEQLGLKLDSQTDPVDVVVLDHVERPSEN